MDGELLYAYWGLAVSEPNADIHQCMRDTSGASGAVLSVLNTHGRFKTHKNRVTQKVLMFEKHSWKTDMGSNLSPSRILHHQFSSVVT